MKKTIKAENVINKRLLRQKLVKRRGGQLFCNMGSFWKPTTSEETGAYIRSRLPEDEAVEISTNVMREVINRIRQLEQFELPDDVLAPDCMMNFMNGILDLETGSFQTDREKTPVFLYCNDCFYHEDATLEQAPSFKQFCETSLDGDEKKRKLLLQIFGYCISGLQAVKAGFFFIGEANSGKSLMLELVQRVVGDAQVTNIPFDKLGSRFNKARLALSRVNICTELAGGKMKDIDFFKTITAHERVTADNKGETPFEFRVRTKLLTAGNVMPAIPETTGAEAILNRMIILRFNRAIPQEEMDKELLDKLLEEIDVIFSLAAKELMQLMKNGYRFSEPADSLEYKAIIKSSLISVDEFLREECEFVPESREYLKTLWGSYLDFCDNNGYEVKMSTLQFSQKLLEYPELERKKFRINGDKPLWGFQGLRIK